MIKKANKMNFTKNMGLLPDIPIYIGDRTALEMELSVITYDSTSAEMIHLSNIDELTQYQNDSRITWINITGLI